MKSGKDKKTDILKVFFIAFFLMFVSTQAINNIYAAEFTKTSDGFKGTLKIDPSKSMVDFYLYDSKGGLVADASVKATITLPGGKKVEKELMGMKMGGSFSFMNTLDMASKGRYSFDILIKSGDKNDEFHFIFDK